VTVSYVSDSEMEHPDLTDAEIDELIDGRGASGVAAPLAEFVAALRSEYSATPDVTAGPALAEFLDVIELKPTPVAATAGSSRRNRVLAGVAAFVATTTGKIVLGTAVAAASVGGAHAAEVIDVPGLPEASTVPAFVETNDSSGEANVFGEGISEFVRDTVLTGCERGQAASALATANASEPRHDPERDHEPCRASDDAVDDAADAVNSSEPGVDGVDISDAASSGNAQEQDVIFGTDVADDATEQLPARPEQTEVSGRPEDPGQPDGTGQSDE
jgi:hypothetical protein